MMAANWTYSTAHINPPATRTNSGPASRIRMSAAMHGNVTRNDTRHNASDIPAPALKNQNTRHNTLIAKVSSFIRANAWTGKTKRKRNYYFPPEVSDNVPTSAIPRTNFAWNWRPICVIVQYGVRNG